MRPLLPSPLVSRAWLMVWLWLFAAALAWAQDLRPVPVLQARVIDQTGTLNDSQRQDIEARLQALESDKGSQLVVLIVPSTAPEDIASYANRVANAWKIGRRDVGDGILLVVAKDDRRLRIEVAKSLEGAVPDLAAKRVIDEAISPRFRQGDYAGGIAAGVDRLAALVRGETLPAVDTARQNGAARDSDASPMELLLFLLFALPVGSAIVRGIFGRKIGALLTGVAAGTVGFLVTASVLLAGLAGIVGLVFALISGASGLARASRWGGLGSGGLPGHGGWSSGGGGGGFSSGGGGDFGGGGASGNW